ncbi:zinc finger protein 436-like [Nerophis ophidion]|uniref:zinc finger protein 436-like n=1 Tax=Nerophis ophidion TaxID=159077 RepID=UPI002ADF2EBB|nr:zinc finger protein 436-like [Nerophis ophidion]
MDDYCYAKMATSCQRESERESAPPTSSKSPTEIKIKTEDEDIQQLISYPELRPTESWAGRWTLKQEDAQPPRIKKEEEELWISQEGECLLRPEEAKLTKFPLTVVSVKTEDDEDNQQLSSHQEELPSQLQWVDSNLKQEDPQSPQIKEEEEHLWITREGGCLLGTQEADFNKLPLTVVSVKIEDDEEKPLIGHPEELPPQLQIEGPTLKQEHPWPLHFKEKKKEFCIIQEAGLTKSRLTVSGKTEDDEEKPPGTFRWFCPADNQQLSSHQEELPSQLQWVDSRLKQEDPQPPQIKEEEEQLWITREGGRLLADLSTEDDEEKPQPDKFLAPLSVSEAEDDDEEPLSSDTDCEGDMRTHTDNKQSKCAKVKHLSCSVGGKNSTHKNGLTQQIRTHTGEKPFDCPVCGKSFFQRGYLTGHMRTHTRERSFNCSVCAKNFTQKNSLTEHMRTHTGEKPFNCSACAKNFTHRSSWTQHMRTHTGEKTFNCSACDKNFSHQSSLIQHMRTHTGEKPFNCSECGKNFTHRSSLNQHMRRHTGEKPFNCSACDKNFTLKIGLIEHMRIHTGEKPFNCSVCSKSFFRKSHLTEHMTTHTGEKSFDCSVCGKNFTQKSSLTQHMRTHTGEKPFNCSLCDKNFTHRSSLTQHMRTHTGEQPFNCSACAKSFTHRSSWAGHMRTHTGEKKFKCSICLKDFALKSSLTEHMRTHTGEKPFSCSLCDKNFSQKSNMAQHMKTHTGEKTFNCLLCGKSFSRKGNLMTHMTTHKRKDI